VAPLEAVIDGDELNHPPGAVAGDPQGRGDRRPGHLC
jgi:hypothetical protein